MAAVFVSGTRPPLRLSALVALVAALAVLGLTTASARAATIQTFQVPTANAGLLDMAEGPDGNLYFTEDNDVVVGGQETFHVGELTTGGQVSELPVPFGDSDSSGTGMGPTSITSSGGRLWFLCDVGGSLYTMGSGMTGLTKTASPSGPTGFDSADELAPAPGGGVWATTIDGGAVELFDAAGNETDFSVNYTDPGTLAENPSGGIDYGNGSSSINTIDASGNTASYPLPSDVGVGEVYSMAFDAGGNLWYGTFSGGGGLETGPYYGTIGVLRPGAASGQTVVNFAPNDGIGPYPIDMVRGPDGAIWFS